MIAASRGHDELVDFLLECGANAELVDNQGMTAYDFASLKGKVHIASVLKSHMK
jgi:ankyrin repeat protein